MIMVSSTVLLAMGVSCFLAVAVAGAGAIGRSPAPGLWRRLCDRGAVA